MPLPHQRIETLVEPLEPIKIGLDFVECLDLVSPYFCNGDYEVKKIARSFLYHIVLAEEYYEFFHDEKVSPNKNADEVADHLGISKRTMAVKMEELDLTTLDFKKAASFSDLTHKSRIFYSAIQYFRSLSTK